MTIREFVAIAVPVLTAIGGGVGWLLNHLEKRAREKEAARLKAEAIDRKLLSLEARDGKLAEDLEEVRRDFAQFIQQLFLKSK